MNFRKTPPSKNRFLLINGLMGIGLMLLVALLAQTSQYKGSEQRVLAAAIMEKSLDAIRIHGALIGPEWSELTTTLGDPEAKRTTINPNFAALVVHLLQEAGVQRGDTIAIGSSASFPALLIASLSAAKAMELNPMVIFSYGSSSFGASNPAFNIWDIYRLLLDNQIVDFMPVAASFGGEDDTGSEFDTTLTHEIKLSLMEAGIPLISEKDLQKNRLEREKYYFNGNPDRIKAFINSGGGFANLGSSPSVLKIRPGLVKRAILPEPEKRGMIHAMLEKNIPVIHLLYIKGLARKYDLQWDSPSQPVVTPQSVEFDGGRNTASLIASILGVLWFILVLVRYRVLYNTQ
jgi:poly-gamma-glutamate system protein